MSKPSTSPGRRGWLSGERGPHEWSPGVAPLAASPDNPAPPRPGERPPPRRKVHALAPGIAPLLAAHGDPVAVAFTLGQAVGAGTMGPLLGCPSCQVRAGVRLGADLACLVCGHGWGGK